MRITTADVYAHFNQQVERTRAFLRNEVRGACGYSAGVLVDRLTQRTVEIGASPYARAAIERSGLGQDFCPPPGASIDCGGASMAVGSGAITIKPAQFTRGIVEFVSHWVYAMLSILIGAADRRSVQSATLVCDMAPEDIFRAGSDDSFAEFCASGPVAPLRAGTLFISCPVTGTSSNPEVFRYCRHAILEVIRQARLGFTGRLLLLLRQVWLFLAFHIALLRTPILALIAREFAYCAISRELDRRGLVEGIVVTCSSVGSQPLWMRALRNARVHMVWYAQNARPIGYLTDTRTADWPPLRWVAVDRHWVWTNSFARYLSQTVELPTATEVVGPLLWYLPRQSGSRDGSLHILVFDVPAVTDKVMHEIVGEASNYYHPDNLRAFVEDILGLKTYLESLLRRSVSVTMKMKRGMRPHYAIEYFHYVESLCAQGLLSLVPPDDNLFEWIGSSDLVIAYPFTSPAYVAENAGIPCIYYDATTSVARGDFVDSEEAVRFVRGFDELAATAVELLTTARPAGKSPSTTSVMTTSRT